MIGTRLLERYELTEELGRGGMGVVYRAWDPVLSRDVAVKVVSSTTLGRETAERFQREARTVAQMDHPAIVPIHDFGQHEGWLFFVMPWVQGTLLLTLNREGTLVLGETLDIGAQIAEALDYSHSRGVVHRDVKPGNIIVSREQRDPPFDGLRSDNGPRTAPRQRLRPTAASEKPPFDGRSSDNGPEPAPRQLLRPTECFRGPGAGSSNFLHAVRRQVVSLVDRAYGAEQRLAGALEALFLPLGKTPA